MPNLHLEAKAISVSAMIIASKIESDLKSEKNYSPIMTIDGQVYTVWPSFGTDFMVLLDVSAENKKQKWSIISYKQCAVLRANYIYKKEYDSEQRAEIDIEAEEKNTIVSETKVEKEKKPKRTVKVEKITETKIEEEEHEVETVNQSEDSDELINDLEDEFAETEEIANGPGNFESFEIIDDVETEEIATALNNDESLEIIPDDGVVALLATFKQHADPTNKFIYFNSNEYKFNEKTNSGDFVVVQKIDKIVSSQLIYDPKLEESLIAYETITADLKNIVKNSPKGHKTVICIFNKNINADAIKEKLLENPAELNLKDFKSSDIPNLFGETVKIILIKIN